LFVVRALYQVHTHLLLVSNLAILLHIIWETLDWRNGTDDTSCCRRIQDSTEV